MGTGYPLPIRLMGLWEHRELPKPEQLTDYPFHSITQDARMPDVFSEKAITSPDWTGGKVYYQSGNV